MTKKPANDNKPLKARSLSDLGALLAYRSRPEHFEPVQADQSLIPTDAKIEQELKVELQPERRLEITPSLEDIAREMRKKPIRNSGGQVVRIGRLRFSDGDQHEKADKIGPDGAIVQFDRRMPRGAMLGCKERLTVETGGTSSPSAVLISNGEISRRFELPEMKYKSGTRKKKRGKSYSAKESRALIDAAIANTSQMPDVTKCPPGLASGTRQVSDCFIGMKIGSTGKGGGIKWQDAFEKLRDREAWLSIERGLSAKDKKVLDVSMRAKNLSEIGMLAGKGGQYARHVGKRLLVAANDNLTSAMRKKLA